MATPNDIKDALLKLDVKNDDHWTTDGSPRIDALGFKDVKRKDITAAAPQFTRANPVLELPKPTTKDAKDETESKSTSEEGQSSDSEKEEVDKAGEDDTMLLGSNILPSTFTLTDDSIVLLGEVVATAHKRSGLTVKEWNAQEGEVIEGLLQDVVDGLQLKEEVSADESVTIEATEEDELEALLVAKKRELDKAQLVAHEAQKTVNAIQQKIDVLTEQRDRLTAKPHKTQCDIMDFIASQNQQRIARAARFAGHINAGLDPAIAKAPLDQAMARKNSRGTGRPVRGETVGDKQS